MEVLHQSDYDMNVATGKLVPRGPVLCSDELESWTQGLHVNMYIHYICETAYSRGSQKV